MRTGELNTKYLTRGDTYKEVLQFTSNKTPMELSLFTDIRMDIRDGKTTKSPLLYSVSLGDGIEIHSTDDSVLIITIDKSETTKWSSKQYYRDIKFTTSEDEEYTYARGSIQVYENKTL